MSTLAALALWALALAGAVDHDCYEQLAAQESSIGQPPPPPTEEGDGYCPLFADTGRDVRRTQISNGF